MNTNSVGANPYRRKDQEMCGQHFGILGLLVHQPVWMLEYLGHRLIGEPHLAIWEGKP